MGARGHKIGLSFGGILAEFWESPWLSGVQMLPEHINKTEVIGLLFIWLSVSRAYLLGKK